MANERCPICAAEAEYVGLARLECPTAECPNGLAGERTEPARGEQLRLAFDLPEPERRRRPSARA